MKLDEGPPQKKKRPVGAGLSLDKFATAGFSKYDKRAVLERVRKEKIIKHSKLSKLKHKLEAQGALKPLQVKDSVAELEQLEGRITAQDAAELIPRRKQHNAGPGPSSAAAAAAATGDAPGAATGKSAAGGAAQQHDGRGKQGNGAHAHQHWGQQREQGRPMGHGPGAAAGGKRPREAENEEQHDGNDGGDGEQQHEGLKAGWQGKHRPPKPLPAVQRLAQKVAQEKEEQRKAREEAQRQREQRQKHVAEVERSRKQEKHKYFQRTASGQPLMRYRMEKLLQKIEQG